MNDMVLQGIVFLLAAVVAATLFKQLGFGTAVGYLVSGILIGPSVLGVFNSVTAEVIMTH